MSSYNLPSLHIFIFSSGALDTFPHEPLEVLLLRLEPLPVLLQHLLLGSQARLLLIILLKKNSNKFPNLSEKPFFAFST